jgi:beta-galactosidase
VGAHMERRDDNFEITLNRADVTEFRPAIWQLVALLFFLIATELHASERLTVNFNPDWKFIKADVSEATKPEFNDRLWSNVSVPHTFNDTDTFDDWSLLGHRGEQNQWSGRTWYRKTFLLPKSFQGKKVFIEFEAVRQVAEVYLNGHRLGVSKTGFTPFGFDLTPHLRFDQPNVLALMCDNRFMKDPTVPRSGEEAEGKGENGGPTLGELSAKVNATIPENINDLNADQIPWNNPHWHPPHGGIYRNVYLHVTDPLHIALPLYSFLQTAGPYVYATEISGKSAAVSIEVPVQNERSAMGKVTLKVEVLDRAGKKVMSLNQNAEIAAGAKAEFKLTGSIEQPVFWEPDYAYLYRVICSLGVNGETVDTCELPLGIRSVRWDTQNGLFVNGRHLKLHGWGQKPTQEWPGLGAAQPDWLHFYTLNLMKEAGGNFVRWGHCAAGPASIAAADRLGLVVDQPGVDGESDTRGAAWQLRVDAFRDTLIYFRNHPSILIWEGGNQKVSREHGRELRSLMDQYDPQGGRAYAHRRPDKTTAEFMDIGIGTEGGREIASLPVVEGEYDREESPRRVWDDFSPPNFGYGEAKGQTYHLTSEQYAVNQVAQFIGKLDAANHAGGANWVFSDSTSGGRVACEVARTSGEVDGVRLPKEAYYVCQTMFRSDPQVHIIGHWTYPVGTRKNVYVAANTDAVELFLNGKSLGFGKQSDRFLFTFPDLSWAPGELKAVASRNGKAIASQIRRTAGAPVALRLTPITGPGGFRSDGSDIGLIDVEAVDAQGERCPTFQRRVDFAVEGPGVWRGGYNSGKTNSINNRFLDLENGINRVAIRAGRESGRIIVRATCPELKPARVTIESSPFEVMDGLTFNLPALPPVRFPKERPLQLAASDWSAHGQSNAVATNQAGRFTRAFSYSGPTSTVHVEQNAQPGKKIYLDHDDAMLDLPEDLFGADWVQAANADSLYSAVDLMEVSALPGTVVSVAYDENLPRPAWLLKLFKPTDGKIRVNDQVKNLFRREIKNGESLTLGSNVENSAIKKADMYVVFIGPDHDPSRVRADAKGLP